VENYYRVLGIDKNASPHAIKKAFREKAKRLHPDIVGERAGEKMLELLTAYQVLSDADRRYEYDRLYIQKTDFDYRSFLKKRAIEPSTQAKLVLFDLFRNEEETALEQWHVSGGLHFPLEDYLERGDWLDCIFVLAEELEKRCRYYEAFILLLTLIKEERRKPYFKHFTEDIELLIKELVRHKLSSTVDTKTYLDCLNSLIQAGFSAHDEARWFLMMAETYITLKDIPSARSVLNEALLRYPRIPGADRLKKKLERNCYDSIKN
jgi:curved DNA-binding protein CbpA